MLRFISFGSGSSGNCYVLLTENDALMVDIGVGIRTLKKHFKDYGLSLSMIHHVLITHDHADHIKSVGSISYDYKLPVYATKVVHRGIDRNYCVSRKVNAELRCVVTPGESFEIGDFQVTPFSVPHDSSDNVGYFIEGGGSDICIITDAGEVTPTMAQFINKAHNLVIEANHDREMLLHGPYPQHLKKRIMSGTGHLSNDACAQAVVDNMSEHLHYVWLCHLSEENNHPELARKTVETVFRAHGVIPGKDVELTVLRRTMPTGFYELAE